MGFLDSVRGLFGRPPSLLAAAAATSLATVPAPTATRGIPGGANFSGRLINEPNELLRDQAGYGRAGTYDVGAWKELALSNPFVTAGLDFILGPVADARVDVSEAPEGALPAATAKLHADFLRWALTEAYRLPVHNETAARGFLLSGFSLFEPLAKEVTWAGLPGRTVWVPESLEQRLPNSLDTSPWLEDERGKLTGIRQSGPIGMGGKWERPVLEAPRVLLYSWKREGGNWAGESQLRSVWYLAGRIMPLLLKLSGVTIQREGAGLPVAFRKDGADGVVPDDLTPQQRSDLMTFFANASFHESSGVVLPNGWDVKWIFSPGADKGFILDLWKSLGLVVLQQLSAQQIVLGTDSTGSRSVGEVHDARSMAFVRKVLSFEESVINGDSGEAHTGLARRIIEWNFGPQPAYPRVVLTPKRPELSPKELAEATASAKNAGLFTPTAGDENTFRERSGYAPLTEEERDAAKEKAAALAPQLPKPGEADEPGGDDEDAPKGKALKASAQRGGWVPWRPLRASEARTDFKGIDAYFTARRDEFAVKARLAVVAMLAKAGPLITSAMADGVVRPEEIAAIPLDPSRLSKVVEQYLAEVRDAGKASTRAELATGVLRAAAEEEQEEQEDREDEVITQEADDVIEAERNRVVRRIVNRTKAELEREAVDALRTGTDAAEVLDRVVARQLDTGAFKGDAGSITTKAFSVGRDEAARILGGVAEVEYSALLDSSTCEACRSLDGATAPFNSAEHDRLVPPNRDCAGGDNCRCLLLFIPSRDGEGEE